MGRRFLWLQGSISLLIMMSMTASSRSLPGLLGDESLRKSSIKAVNHFSNGRRLDSSELSYVYHNFFDSFSCTGNLYFVQAMVLDLCITYVYDDYDSPELDNYTVYTKTELTSTNVTISYYTDDTCTDILTKLSELEKVRYTHSRWHGHGDDYIDGTILDYSSYDPFRSGGNGTYTQVAKFDEAYCSSYFSITSSTGISYPSSDAIIIRDYAYSDTACTGMVYSYSSDLASVCFPSSSEGNQSYFLRLNDSYFDYAGCSESTLGKTMGPYYYATCSYNTEDDSRQLERGYYSRTPYYVIVYSAANSPTSSPSPGPTSSSIPTSSSLTTKTILPTQVGVLVSMATIAAHVAIVLWTRLSSGGVESKDDDL